MFSGVPAPSNAVFGILLGRRAAQKEASMSLEDLGNIGEFVEAFAVVVALIYLSLQIRLSTGAVKVAENLHWLLLARRARDEEPT